MKAHELKVKSHKSAKRVGRGISAGQGKTAGRGTKGQNARTGGGVRPGFEGGQNPLMKRTPKVRGGFSRPKSDLSIIHTDQLNVFSAKAKVDKDALIKKGLLKKSAKTIKLLNRGKLKTAVELTVDSASEKARQAVESAGGKLITRQK